MLAALLASVGGLVDRRAQLSFADAAGREVELSLAYFVRAERAVEGLRLGLNLFVVQTRECEPVVDTAVGQFFAAAVRVPSGCDPAHLARELISHGAQMVFLDAREARQSPMLAADVWEVPLFLLEQSSADLLGLTGSLPARRYVTVAFAMPSGPGDRIRVTLVYEPAHEYTRRFLDAVEKLRTQLGDVVVFDPRVFTFSSQAEEYVQHHCVAQGAYCAVPPGAPGATGRSVVVEALRQKCVFAHGPSPFFAYMRQFYARCAHDLTEECSKRCAEATGIAFDAVQRCVTDSFSKVAAEPFENDNRSLAEDQLTLKRLGVERFPELLVNDVHYKGSLAAADLLFAVCSAMGGKGPACHAPSERQSSPALLTASLVVFGLGSAALFVLCRRLARRRQLHRLDKAVDRYLTDYGRVSDAALKP